MLTLKRPQQAEFTRQGGKSPGRMAGSQPGPPPGGLGRSAFLDISDKCHKQGYRRSQTTGHAAKENLAHNGSIRREAKVFIPSSCRA